MKVIIVLYTIVVLLCWPVDSRQCYDCSCEYNSVTALGSCGLESFLSSCTLKESSDQYCKISSTYSGDTEVRYFQSVAPDFYKDSHFFEAIETISLSGTTWLPPVVNSIAYVCDWDGCNLPSIVKHLPGSFQMNIDPTVLDTQLVNEPSSAPSCCSNIQCINNTSNAACPEVPCDGGTCYIDEIHSYVLTETNQCVYYYSSACQQRTTSPQTTYVRIRAIHYIDLPAIEQLEVDEVDIRCTKNLCNSIQTVEILKAQIKASVIIDPDFQPSRVVDASAMNLKRSNIFLCFLPLLLLF